MSKETTPEAVLNETAKKIMIQWNLNSFKETHPHLFKAIIKSMTEYAKVKEASQQGEVEELRNRILELDKLGTICILESKKLYEENERLKEEILDWEACAKSQKRIFDEEEERCKSLIETNKELLESLNDYQAEVWSGEFTTINELKNTLRGFLNLESLIQYKEIIKPEHEGEAEAIAQLFSITKHILNKS